MTSESAQGRHGTDRVFGAKKIAATHAADAGLEVWLCPFTNGLTQDELLDLLADCAEHAERLRRNGAEVVMLTGSELSLFTLGFLPGERLEDRLALVADPLRVRPMIAEVRARINDFLRRAAQVVRARFGGKVSYASLPLEGVDWAPFDIIATDAAYRTKETAPHFRENIRAFVAQGRPARLNGEYVRDEDEQATYLREVLEVFEAEGVDNAFVNTFARYDLPHRSDPHADFDLASFGVVKVLDGQSGARGQRYPDMPWEIKPAFTTLADYYGR